MKKLLITIIALLIFPNLSLANTQQERVCTFPNNGVRTTTVNNKTTIDFNHCTALNTGTTSGNCREAITKSDEYIQSSSQTSIRDKAEESIKLCETQLGEIQTLMESTENSNNQIRNIINNTRGSCITNDSNLNTTSSTNGNNDPRLQVNCSLQSGASQGLVTLQNVFENRFVFQLIEPLTDENLVIQRRTCTYEFLRNKDGLIQAADISANRAGTERDSNFYDDNLFTITEKACFITYVDQCDPQLVLDTRISINEELPVSTYCQTFQVISGSSGVGFIQSFVNIIYRLAVGIIGVIAVIVMVVNGIRISTAGDDSGAISEAKERIAQSIFGLAVLFLAWIILRSVNPNFFTTEDLQIQDPRNTQATEQTQNTTTNTNSNAN